MITLMINKIKLQKLSNKKKRNQAIRLQVKRFSLSETQQNLNLILKT